MVCPIALAVGGLGYFSSVNRGLGYVITVANTGLEVTKFAPALPVTVAVLIMDPSSKSCCVTVCEWVQVVVAPGAKGLVAPEQSTSVGYVSSVTVKGPVKDRVPVFCIV